MSTASRLFTVGDFEELSACAAEFLPPDSPVWQHFLSSHRHDFYHTPQYLALSSNEESGEPLAFYAQLDGVKFLLPLLKRQIPGGGERDFDLSSPYGYPGPLFSTPVSGAELKKFYTLFQDRSREAGFVSAFLRSHPIINERIEETYPSKLGTLVSHGPTVSIDLVNSSLSKYRKSTRYEIRRLEREGFQVEIDDFSLLPDFIDLYHKSMARLQARSFYFFKERYFQSLKDEFEGRFHLFTVRSKKGEIAASAIFIECCDLIQYHLAATSDDFRQLAPGKLLIDKAAEWGRERGAKALHLGGGNGNEASDPLFRYKAGFSDERHEFFTWRLVTDSKRYSELVALHKVREEDFPGFFPLYRALGAR